MGYQKWVYHMAPLSEELVRSGVQDGLERRRPWDDLATLTRLVIPPETNGMLSAGWERAEVQSALADDEDVVIESRGQRGGWNHCRSRALMRRVG